MPRPATLTVFVYFRASPADRERVLASLERHFGLIEQRCGIRGRGGLRRDLDKPYLTWLESYEGIDPARLGDVLGAIDACALESGLAEFSPEARHREIFETVSGR